jgi:hypothetical protein
VARFHILRDCEPRPPRNAEVIIDGVPGAEVQDPLDGAPDVGSAIDEFAKEDDRAVGPLGQDLQLGQLIPSLGIA